MKNKIINDFIYEYKHVITIGSFSLYNAIEEKHTSSLLFDKNDKIILHCDKCCDGKLCLFAKCKRMAKRENTLNRCRHEIDIKLINLLKLWEPE